MNIKSFLGMIVLVIGLSIFLSVFVGVAGFVVAPLLFLGLGLYFYRGGRRFLALVFAGVGVVILFDHILHVNFLGVLFAVLCIYFGLRLVRQKDERNPKEERWKRRKKRARGEDGTETPRTTYREEKTRNRSESTRIRTSLSMRRQFIGDVRYTSGTFDLHDMTVWNGIGEVRMDLSKAIVPEGETVIVFQVGIGSITLYVPADLPVSVQAGSVLGDVTLFKEKQTGFNQQVSIETRGFKEKRRRVKVVMATLAGDVKVKEL
ncbi:cell wall-active antibiotics response protein LiaF [Shouchella shacheensis]|uniref:cell wall-active antibiotics response protein LiaF n=1 Tax=Shouchella shacheensis TaxID=1649580 RepID=UPI00073FC8D5|nr:cell wall-active antibiotics response protein LiaF [Shouchella shacheensis]